MTKEEYRNIFPVDVKVFYKGKVWGILAGDWSFGGSKILIFLELNESTRSRWIDSSRVEIIMNPIDRLVLTFCNGLEFTKKELLSKSRSPKLVSARHALWLYLSIHYKYSYSDIGRYFNKDHTTITHGINRAEELLSVDDVLIKKYVEVIKNILT